MLCGNDPIAHARLTSRDRAVIRWFRDTLAWQRLVAGGSMLPAPDFEVYVAAAGQHTTSGGQE